MILYTLTVFVGALLLFLVQPMAARAILPTLGGSPAVWNTCMLFFQAALLAGYAYAHGLARVRRVGVWAAVQAVVVLLPLLVLGRVVPSAAGAPPMDHPMPWLLVLLATTVGPFFVVLSTTGPLLQRWFGATDLPHAADPYFLYAASNAGSLLALLAYPTVVEPWLSLPAQARLLAGGYVAYAALVLACGAVLIRRGVPAAVSAVSTAGAPISNRTRLLWVGLSFAPSSLMLGVTQYLSTDIAAVPLLWIVPLAIYLLTFVLAFSPRWVLGLRVASLALPLGALTLVGTMLLEEDGHVELRIALHLLVLFLGAYVCHRRLAEGRPGAARLTEFYLYIAVGGVLGGVFNAIVAPRLFTSVAEYPIALVLVCALRPPGGAMAASAAGDARRNRLVGLAAVVLPAGVLGLVLAVSTRPDRPMNLDTLIPWVIASLAVCAALIRWPGRMAAALGLLLMVSWFRPDPAGRLLYAERTFFGVMRVYQDYNGWVVLRHGTTRHGLQIAGDSVAGDDEGLRLRRVPTMYYHRGGPIGDVFRVRTGTEGFDRCAFVGLGAGTLAAYGRPGMEFTFYEIDPAVARIAADTTLFHYLEDCLARINPIVLGDARLSIRAAPDGEYDLIVLDAFSSDAVPVHLLTKEAIGLYVRKTSPGGILAFHVSSRYLDLRPVLAAAARDLGMAAMARTNDRLTAEEEALGATRSRWVVLARNGGDLAALAGENGWARLSSDPSFPAWTDDYSNILGVFGVASP